MAMETREDRFGPLDYGVIHLFRNVDPDSIRGLLDGLGIVYLEESEILIKPGQRNDRLYLIADGRIRIHLHDPATPPVAVLARGESVGEMSLIDGEPTSAYAIADEPSRLLVMEEDALWSLVRFSHEAACNLLAGLVRRLRGADAVITGIAGPEGIYERHGSFDVLTGLRNRTWLEGVMPRLVSRAERDSTPLCAVLVGLEDFDVFTKIHGGIYANRVLYFFAHTLSENLRPTELTARYEPDRFVVVLPGVGPEGALAIARRLKAALMETIPLMPDGNSVPIPTVVMSITQWERGEESGAFLRRLGAPTEELAKSCRVLVPDGTTHSG
ncbi:MAG TPA: GGDEF domain-containing protein [Syntrophales bacterium]|nr:GGDEF domain-containing protein [Syntrophales bacterium]HRS87763.1 GGDEF domain-containing protein [Syntrophales bacterium]HRV43231.1 GGDEF domain-containing protein [Syntrophales bacterium]